MITTLFVSLVTVTPDAERSFWTQRARWPVDPVVMGMVVSDNYMT